MARKAIEDAIYTKLTTDQAAGSFYDDVGGRISLNEASDSKALPHCVLAVITDVPARFLGGKRDANALFDIDIYSNEGIATLQVTNGKLFTLLDNSTITITGFTLGYIQCQETGIVGIDDDRTKITSTWRVIAKES